MTKEVFEQIQEGLSEALSVARRENVNVTDVINDLEIALADRPYDGPWRVEECQHDGKKLGLIMSGGTIIAEISGYLDYCGNGENARYIAACSPDKVRALLDHVSAITAALSTSSTPADGEDRAAPVANLQGLTTFAKAMIQVAFQGGDISGADIQELGVQHGLLSCVPFDPEKHKDPEGYAEEGEYWCVYAGPLATTEAAE